MLIRMGLGGQLSGSVGGVTASHNRYGQYLRNRTRPVNPNSTAQQRSRNAFKRATEAWKTLTNDQRAAWEAYASQTPVLNKLGESVTLTGSAAFVAYNAFVLNVVPDVNLTTNAPASPGLATVQFTDIAIDVSDMAINFNQTGGPAGIGVFIAVLVGPSLSPGVNSFNGPYTLVSATDDGQNGPMSMPFETNRYGLPVTGQRRAIKIRAADGTTRKLTSETTAIVTVVA